MISDSLQVQTGEEISFFVERLTQELGSQPQDDRRSEPRFAVNVPVEVHPLNEAFEPDGPSFEARTRDISASGISFVHRLPVKSRFLAVGMQTPHGDSIDLVVDGGLLAKA